MGQGFGPPGMFEDPENILREWECGLKLSLASTVTTGALRDGHPGAALSPEDRTHKSGSLLLPKSQAAEIEGHSWQMGSARPRDGRNGLQSAASLAAYCNLCSLLHPCSPLQPLHPLQPTATLASSASLASCCIPYVPLHPLHLLQSAAALASLPACCIPCIPYILCTLSPLAARGPLHITPSQAQALLLSHPVSLPGMEDRAVT